MCLVVIGLSDFLDGLLARLCAAMTTLGARLDPLADKLAAVTITGSFAAAGFVPWAFLLVLLVPDLILLTTTRGRNPPTASRLGKARTALLLISFPLVLAGQAWQLPDVASAGLILLAAGAVGHLAAAVHYGSMIIRSRSGSGRS